MFKAWLKNFGILLGVVLAVLAGLGIVVGAVGYVIGANPIVGGILILLIVIGIVALGQTYEETGREKASKS